MEEVPCGAPPSRHPGSRTVLRQPSLVRAVAVIRNQVGTTASRVRREDMICAPADPARGEPAVSATMANTHVTRVSRSGHSLFFDVAVYLGPASGSVMSVRLSVPDLSITGVTVTSATSDPEQDLRVRLDMPATWDIGASFRVYVQAMRVSGSDSTTVRVLRAWQR